MARSVRMTVRLPKEVADRITALHDWIFAQPELALARRSSTTATAFVIMKGLEVIEAAVEHEQALAQTRDDAPTMPPAPPVKAPPRVKVSEPKGYDAEAGPTMMLGSVYNEWAKTADDADDE